MLETLRTLHCTLKCMAAIVIFLYMHTNPCDNNIRKIMFKRYTLNGVATMLERPCLHNIHLKV